MKFTLFITILSLFISCSKDNGVIVVVNQNGNPEISTSNGELSIDFVPVEGEGTIGYDIDSVTYWLVGMPEKSNDDGKSVYKWNTEEGDVTLAFWGYAPQWEFKLTFEGKDNRTPSRWHINIKATDTEYFTGLFERVVDGSQGNSWKDSIQTAMNLRGEVVEMKLKPTVSGYAPFYISSNNYGMFVGGTWPGVYDFCKSEENIVKVSFEGPSLAFKIYTGTPAEIVKMHAVETGPSFVPPKWAFGPWRWRDNHHNNPQYYDGTTRKAPFCTDVVEDVLMMQAFDIPHTAVWIDRPWGPGTRGFDDYEFDTARLPDPEGMIKWLNSKNLELMMWIGPFVMGDMASYAEEHGYNLNSKVWMESRQILMDFTNEEGVKWWGENGPGKLARMGVKGFKLDRADGEKLTDSIHLTTSIGTTYRENFNDYPRQYVKATYDAVQPVLGDDFILFPRAQYTGSSKYGGMWSGDPHAKKEGLRSVIIAMQRCAIMGYPVWGSDVGGYNGTLDHEVGMRWLGFGCFSPIFEVGPTDDRGFWNNQIEPAYNPELIATWRLYSKIRMGMIDYLHNLAQVARETGMPIARPLYLHYPEQQGAWDDWQTYLLGSDILVSAIWDKGKTEHTLYFPEGETWVDAWDGKEYKGGAYQTVDAPMQKTPVFIRKGSEMNLGDLNALWEESLEIASKKPDLAELEKKEGWR